MDRLIGYSALRYLRVTILLMVMSVLMSGCAAVTEGLSAFNTGDGDKPSAECSATEPEWITPPEDSAVDNDPEPGYYYVNEDRSIWAAAWWYGLDDAADYIRAGELGIKTGFFRPAGADLEITGERLDGESPPLDGHAPCCYPTRFQAVGLKFPTEGCWEVIATAEDSVLTFILEVYP